MHSRLILFPSPLFYLALAAAASLLHTGCGPEFKGCDAKRTCPTTGGGGAGGDGQGGSQTSGGRTTPAGGGSGTANAGTANASTGGSTGGNVGASGGAPSSVAGNGAGGNDAPGGLGGIDEGGDGAGGSSGNPGGSGAGGGSGPGTAGVGGEAGAGGDAGTASRCGDGIVRDLEQCDDGNQDPADGCRPDCTWGPRQVIAGQDSSCVLFGDGSAKCWGSNGSGQLGQADVADRGDAPGELATLKPIQIATKVAKFTTLAIRSTACGVSAGELWCWGANVRGEAGAGLADGSPVLNPHHVDLGETVRSVAVGGLHACALLASGQVKCWGLSGLLGNGHPENGNVGDAPGEIGPSLLAVSLPEPATEIVTGSYHTCALLKSGALACWGSNTGGKLGLGNADDYDYGRVAPATQPTVNLGSGAVALQIAGGDDHTCALLSAQAPFLKCWGLGTYGALGYGDETARGETPEQLGSNLTLVPITTSADPVAAVYGLSGATCALLKSGSVKCWGNPFDGVLAQPELVGALGSIGDAPNELSQLSPIDLGTGARVRSLAVGARHACALLSTGEVKCWGANEFGQLGIGSTETIGDARAELGSALKAVPLN